MVRMLPVHSKLEMKVYLNLSMLSVTLTMKTKRPRFVKREGKKLRRDFLELRRRDADTKADPKGKKPDPKAAPPAKPGAKGGKAEAVPDGQIVNVS